MVLAWVDEGDLRGGIVLEAGSQDEAMTKFFDFIDAQDTLPPFFKGKPDGVHKAELLGTLVPDAIVSVLDDIPRATLLTREQMADIKDKLDFAMGHGTTSTH